MADTTRHRITPGQLFVFLLTSEVGLGLLALPRHVVHYSGHSGWLVLIPISITAAIGTLIGWKVCQRFNGSILAVNRRVFGRFAGALLNWLIIGLLLVSSVANAGLYTQAIMILFFRETPVGVLAAALIVPWLYLLMKGLKVLARFDSFVFLAIASVLGLVVAYYDSLNWNFILPLFPNNLVKALLPVPELFFPFAGFNLILIVFPHVYQGKTPRDPLNYALGALITASAMFIVFVLLSLALYGEEFVHHQVFTILNLFRRLSVPVLERLDIFFATIWLPAMGADFTSYLMAAELSLEELFPKVPRKAFSAAVTILTVMGILLLRNFGEVEDLSIWAGAAEFLGLGLFLPVLAWGVGRLRGVSS